jgi:nucleotide-binding universal stress UspA family protein
MNLNEILVAVDFSDCSINALEHAITIAQKSNANIHMVYVTKAESAKSSVEDGDCLDPLVEAESQFKALIKKYKIRMKGKEMTFSIRTGKIYREIVQTAEERDVFMLVAGTHGKSGFEEFWIGSNAFRLVTAAKRPVITIREGIQVTRSLRNIVMPLDSTVETRQKAPFTAILAGLFDAKVHILLLHTTSVRSVRNKVWGYGEQVAKYFSKNNIKYVLEEVDVDNITNSTIEYAKKVDANLISIMTEQEKSTANLWLGPYAQQMVNHSPFPVLSIQPQEYLRTTY